MKTLAPDLLKINLLVSTAYEANAPSSKYVYLMVTKNEIEKFVTSHGFNEIDWEIVEMLQDDLYTEYDLINGGIPTAKVHLGIETLLPLIDIMTASSSSLLLKQEAALAIAEIGSGFVKPILLDLGKNGSKELKELVNMALS